MIAIEERGLIHMNEEGDPICHFDERRGDIDKKNKGFERGKVQKNSWM